MNTEEHPPEHLEWTVCPVMRSFLISSGVFLLCLTIPSGIYLDSQDPWIALVALVIIFSSIRSFYLPTRFVLDREGVSWACFPLRSRRPWRAFKSWQAFNGSIRLSTFDNPSRLDSTRGLLLRFDEEGERIKIFLRDQTSLIETGDS